VQPAIKAPDGASRQRPVHRADGVTTVATDETCVYVEASFETPYGLLIATVAMPHTFLADNFSSKLSNNEVGLLAVLNAGVPPHLKAGKPRGYRVMHLAGLITREAAAQKILELSKGCTLNIRSLRDRFSDLDELTRRLGSEHRCRLLSLWLLPLNEEASKQAEDVQSAAQAAAASNITLHTCAAIGWGETRERTRIQTWAESGRGETCVGGGGFVG
jgi:hypothetical protein